MVSHLPPPSPRAQRPVLIVMFVMMQGARAVNGLVTGLDVPADKDSGVYKLNYMPYDEANKSAGKQTEEFDLIIGSDGANSRVAKVHIVS